MHIRLMIEHSALLDLRMYHTSMDCTDTALSDDDMYDVRLRNKFGNFGQSAKSHTKTVNKPTSTC